MSAWVAYPPLTLEPVADPRPKTCAEFMRRLETTGIAVGTISQGGFPLYLVVAHIPS
jgi:hypothetical protein